MHIKSVEKIEILCKIFNILYEIGVIYIENKGTSNYWGNEEGKACEI